MTLTIQDLGALGELLGSVAVLATLVYLALQTRQNTMAISAQLEAAALSANQNWFLSVATSGDLAEALNEDSTAPRTTNETRRLMYWSALINGVQWQHHQARRGLLPIFHEAATGGVMGSFFTMFRGVEDFWESVKSAYQPEFVEWVEEQRSKAA